MRERQGSKQVFTVEEQKGGMIHINIGRLISRSQRGKEGRGFPAQLPAWLPDVACPMHSNHLLPR